MHLAESHRRLSAESALRQAASDSSDAAAALNVDAERVRQRTRPGSDAVGAQAWPTSSRRHVAHDCSRRCAGFQVRGQHGRAGRESLMKRLKSGFSFRLGGGAVEEGQAGRRGRLGRSSEKSIGWSLFF